MRSLLVAALSGWSLVPATAGARYSPEKAVWGRPSDRVSRSRSNGILGWGSTGCSWAGTPPPDSARPRRTALVAEASRSPRTLSLAASGGSAAPGWTLARSAALQCRLGQALGANRGN